MINNKISFYYVYWQHDNSKRFETQVLLLSIILLNVVYPESNINIVFYTDVPKEFDIIKNIRNVYFIEQKNNYIKSQQKHNKLLNIDNGNNLDCPYLLSKPLDCFYMAKANEESVVILDCDFFVFKKFINLDFNKVGFWFWDDTPKTGANTGLISFGTKSFQSSAFFNIYIKMLNIFNDGCSDKKNALIKQVYGTVQSLQEEIIFSLIKQQNFELNNIMFYNIKSENHQLYIPNKHIDYSRNIHTACIDKKRICPVLCNCNYIKKIISEYEHGKFINEFKTYKQVELSKEEIRLVNNINNCLDDVQKTIKFF